MHTGDEIRREVTEFDRWRYGGIISPRLLGYAMAKRKYSVKRRKIEPAVQTITLGIGAVPAVYPPGQPTLATYFVDLSQIACVVNRRAYRQGINWAIAGMKVTAASGTSGDVRVKKLPNTWVMAEAWKKSMRAWLRMSREAMEESPSVRPRFMDFKIYANSLVIFLVQKKNI